MRWRHLPQASQACLPVLVQVVNCLRVSESRADWLIGYMKRVILYHTYAFTGFPSRVQAQQSEIINDRSD